MVINTTFSYGGIDSSVFNITCDRETHSILSTQRKYVQEIPGLDGYVDFGIGGYDVRVIQVPLYFNGDYAELRANREKIIAWLSNKKGKAKQLIFNNEPTKYYMAKVYNAVTFENSSDRNIGTITFECNPPWQFENDVMLTPEQITWNNQDSLCGTQWLKKFTESGSLKLTNTGTKEVKPIIKLYGNIPCDITLTCGDLEWSYFPKVTYDGIIINCENETVTRASDGKSLFDNVDPYKDDFFTFPVGKVKIKLTTSDDPLAPNVPMNLTMIVDFKPMIGV